MTDGTSNPARHFGREVRRARLAAKMTLAEFGRAIGYDPGQISRVERGVRPPAEKFAQLCDKVFHERDGWFERFYQESRQWAATPPWFRNWIEHEQRAIKLQVWQPSVLSGLLQTDAYARALLRTFPGATEEQVAERLAARMARQAILTREDLAPPVAWFLVDEAALRRCTGTPEIMADQLDRLAVVAGLSNVTIQVVPDVAHAALTGGFAIAEAVGGAAAYIETALTGQVFEDAEAVRELATRFDALRTEALRGTESLHLIEKMASQWKQQATGASPATRAPTAANA
ncbi:MAG: helix-turn-helix domain-containing protein [Streptosporangiaceae bacterium]